MLYIYYNKMLLSIEYEADPHLLLSTYVLSRRKAVRDYPIAVERRRSREGRTEPVRPVR